MSVFLPIVSGAGGQPEIVELYSYNGYTTQTSMSVDLSEYKYVIVDATAFDRVSSSDFKRGVVHEMTEVVPGWSASMSYKVSTSNIKVTYSIDENLVLTVSGKLYGSGQGQYSHYFCTVWGIK